MTRLRLTASSIGPAASCWVLAASLPTLGGIEESKIDEAMEKYLHFRRVMKDDGNYYSHSKIICVDKKLMYVGRDNAYPCYNEEHGIWVEEPKTVGAWIDGFFKPYWTKCSADVSNEVEFFKKRVQEGSAVSDCQY